MCGICGCSDHPEAAAHDHHHHHDHIIKIEQDIFAENNRYAEQNRQTFQQNNIFTLNFVSSPGSGKTTLLIKTIEANSNNYKITVIEGDQQTDIDTQRIKATGVPALQVNTGKACHLDAHRIGHAIETLAPPSHSLLFIENVGNLVCPALFDLGEAHKVVIISVTEGDDKPLKYPEMFHQSSLMIINKIDLLPYVEFDVNKCADYARRVNPNIHTLQLSATTEQGLEAWQQWLRQQNNAYNANASA